MLTAPRTLRFALSPSLGAMRATTASARLGRSLRKVLAPELSVELVVSESYARLQEDLIAGRVDLAWAPPFVCARVLEAGGSLVVQLSRGGVGSYRSALLCRKDRPCVLEKMEGLVVAWVDRESMAGYRLPLAWLKSQGVDPTRAFREELFTGSYDDALGALLSGKADLTVTYASPPQARRPFSGLDVLSPALRGEIQEFAYTPEFQNDAIVASRATSADVPLLRRRLLAMTEDASGRALLRQVFDADGLLEANAADYLRLQSQVRL